MQEGYSLTHQDLYQPRSCSCRGLNWRQTLIFFSLLMIPCLTGAAAGQKSNRTKKPICIKRVRERERERVMLSSKKFIHLVYERRWQKRYEATALQVTKKNFHNKLFISHLNIVFKKQLKRNSSHRTEKEGLHQQVPRHNSNNSWLAHKGTVYRGKYGYTIWAFPQNKLQNHGQQLWLLTPEYSGSNPVISNFYY